MPAQKKAKTGRKPLPPGAGKTDRLQLRINPTKKAYWATKAKAAKMSLPAWIESKCDEA